LPCEWPVYGLLTPRNRIVGDGLPGDTGDPRPSEIRTVLDQVSTKKIRKTRKQRPNRARVITTANAGTLVSGEVRMPGKGGRRMAESGRATGTPNTIYDLLSWCP
jgi:hypothetical protein